MNFRRGILIVAALVAACAGCRPGSDGRAGAPIGLERAYAERSYELEPGSPEETFTFKADMEYPSHYGISADEYARLTGFVNALFNGGSNFVTTVDEVSRDVFKGIQEASTNENLDAEADLDMEIKGRVAYADDRYFSYELNLRGICFDSLRCTYDRTLARPVTIGDLVPPDRLGRLRGCMRDHVRLAFGPMGDGMLKGRPDDWPPVKDAFSVDERGLTWDYSHKELEVGARMEIRVGWDELKDIVADRSLLPTGRFAPTVSPRAQRDEPDWWKFPYERQERMQTAPPCPPFAGTNSPAAEVTLKIESPCPGGMATRKFTALQKCLARAIAPRAGAACVTVAEAVQSEVVHFWERQIAEWDGESPDSGFGAFRLETKVAYRGPEYVSFRIDRQEGCPCGAGTTNLVWSWRTEAPLRIDEVVDRTATAGLKRLMRQRVREDLRDDYDEDSGIVLPDYAKDWPHELDDFSLDTRGVTWFCDAGEVIVGGKGSYETFLSWAALAPFLKRGFVVPKE